MRITILRRFKLVVEKNFGNQRVTFRFRTMRRPKQINFTITRYTPRKGTGRGVS